MLNIEELYKEIKDPKIPAEERLVLMLVVAEVEQRTAMQRIAELLDVHHMDLSEIESVLNRIADALEARNADIDAIAEPFIKAAAAGPKKPPG